MLLDLSYLSYPLPPDIQRLYEAGDFARMDRVIRLRLDDPMTVGELAMLLTPKADAIARRVAQLRRTGRAGAYDGAMAWCRENGLVSAAAHPADHVTALPEAWFVPTDGFTRRDVYAAFRMERL